MKKFTVFLLILLLSPLIGGAYGILHDQLTYSISPEYYTKFKFYQFGLMDLGNEAIFPSPRVQVSYVGFLASWWMGMFIGGLLALVGLIHKSSKVMFQAVIRAMLLVLSIAFVIGMTGLLYGKMYLSRTEVQWWMPENLVDTANYIAVGSMHNFSYSGGVIGLIFGIVYIIRFKPTIPYD